jgi:hypothetical protein
VPSYRLVDYDLLDVPPGRFRHGFLQLANHRVGELSQESGRGPRFAFTSPELRDAFAKAYSIADAKGWADVGLEFLNKADKDHVLRRAKAGILRTVESVRKDAEKRLVTLENTPGGAPQWIVHDVKYSRAAAKLARAQGDVILVLNEDPKLESLRSGRAS